MDPYTRDLKKHFNQEGSLDIQKFRSEQKTKVIKNMNSNKQKGLNISTDIISGT